MTCSRRVVITGLGVVGPLGVGAAAFWDGLLEQRSGVKRLDRFAGSALPCTAGADAPRFKVADFVPKTYRKSVKLMSRDIELAVVAAHEAAVDAKLPTRCLIERGEIEGPSIDPTRFGVNIGAGLICPDIEELAAAFSTAVDERGGFDIKKWGAEGMGNLTPLWLLKFLPNMLACHVTIVHDAQSVSNTITCAEASGLLAIGEAARAIERGAMDVCICGGAEEKTNPMGLARAGLMKWVAADGDDPTRMCRPFAADRSGTVMGEGAGLVVLESLEHAHARGARIYGELVGFGAAGNTHSWSVPDPSGAPLAAAVESALRDADVAINDIDLVGTFGCGTRLHDASELAGWQTALKDRSDPMPAFAIKGLVGTCGAGSASMDFCTAVMAMARNTIPPSANTGPLDAGCGLRFATEGPRDAQLRHVVVAGFAMSGGQTGALVIKRFEESGGG